MTFPIGPTSGGEHRPDLQTRRALKAAEAIRQVVGMAILSELKDPRIRDVTVTYVEVSPDLRHAKVHVSVMGNETKQRLALRGLRSAAGYLQAKCAERIDTRWTPKLEFVLDQGVKRSIEISRILQEVFPEKSELGKPHEELEAEDSEEEGGGEYETQGEAEEETEEEDRPQPE
jgi:ribosome-binding factor A